MSTTHQIEIKANDPAARELLTGAVKWLERIANRKEELPASFLDECDPAPLAKDIRDYLSNSKYVAITRGRSGPPRIRYALCSLGTKMLEDN